MTKMKSRSLWRQKHARYRMVPVGLAPFEVPTWLKAQDIENGVVEQRSENSIGETLNVGRRFLQPLELWHRHGLTTECYHAGKRYGALWREVCQPKSPPHSDPTRIIVDGGGSAPAEFLHVSNGELAEAQAEIRDEETVTMLNRLCGMEDWPLGDKRRFKRKCRKGLEVLAVLWRKR